MYVLCGGIIIHVCIMGGGIIIHVCIMGAVL